MNEEKKFNVALEFRQQTLMNAGYRFLFPYIKRYWILVIPIDQSHW